MRLRIACRDVTKVPKTAKGTLGLYIIDFGFEREVPIGGGDRTLKSGIKVGDDAQPPPKKSKVDLVTETSGHWVKENTGLFQILQKQSSGKQVQNYWSAPPKVGQQVSWATKVYGRCTKGLQRSQE